jgi:hypothetical protein
MSTYPPPGQYACGPFAAMYGTPWPCGFHTTATRPDAGRFVPPRSGASPAARSFASTRASGPPSRMIATRRNAATNAGVAYLGPRDRPDSSNAQYAFQ